MFRKVLTAGVTVLASIGLSAASASAATAPTQTIVVRAHQTSSTFSGGTAFSFHERLTQGSRVVGHNDVSCRINAAQNGAACVGAFVLGHTGTLFIRAFLDFTSDNPDTRVRIVGGTGALTGATGNAVVHPLHLHNPNTDNRITITYHL